MKNDNIKRHGVQTAFKVVLQLTSRPAHRSTLTRTNIQWIKHDVLKWTCLVLFSDLTFSWPDIDGRKFCHKKEQKNKNFDFQVSRWLNALLWSCSLSYRCFLENSHSLEIRSLGAAAVPFLFIKEHLLIWYKENNVFCLLLKTPSGRFSERIRKVKQALAVVLQMDSRVERWWNATASLSGWWFSKLLRCKR